MDPLEQAKEELSHDNAAGTSQAIRIILKHVGRLFAIAKDIAEVTKDLSDNVLILKSGHQALSKRIQRLEDQQKDRWRSSL